MGLEDFGTGFAAGINQDLDRRRQHKLELQMMSKRLEMEQAAKQVPQDQFANAVNYMSGQSRDLTGITNPVAQQAVFSGVRPMLGAQLRSQRQGLPIYQTERVGNRVKFIMRDRITGQVLKEEDRGVNPQFKKEVAQIDSEFGVGNKIIQSIDQRMNKFLSDDYITRLPQGAATRLGSLIQSGDPDAMYLTTAREPFSIWLTSSVSGKQMTEKEQQAFLALLPNPEDTLEYARHKLELLNTMISGRQESAYKAFLGEEPPKKETKKGKASKDPLGLFN